MYDFESLLRGLHSSSSDPVKAECIIKKISKYFTEDQIDLSLDLLLFLVFGEYGIIQFIKKIIQNETNKPVIISLLALTEFLLINFEKNCVPYAEEIKTLCLAVARCSSSVKIQEESLKVLKCVFAPVFISTLDLSTIMETIKHMKDNTHPSVQMQLFSVIGIIYERLPEISHNEDFLAFFLGKMKKKPNPSTLTGCFEGINGYLVHFSPNKNQIESIYSYVKTSCLLQPEQKRRIAGRSALKLFNRHYLIFSSYILKDIEYWREALSRWTKKMDEDGRLGIKGLVAVYRAVAHVFSNTKSGIGAEKLNNEVDSLLRRLESQFSVANMIGLVELLSSGSVCDTLVNRGLQLITMRAINAMNENKMFLSVNLECMAKCMIISTNVNYEYLFQIQRMAVTLIDNYPKIDTYFQISSLHSLERSFYYISCCGFQELNNYVREVIYQGLIRSCSCDIWECSEQEKEVTSKGVITHKSFLPFWLHIINMSSSHTEIEGFEARNIVSGKVFDEYVSSFLKINKKLDLSIRVKDLSDSDSCLKTEATRPNDFRIFVNNIKLFVDIIGGSNDLNMIKKWLTRIFSETMDFCYRSPLISEYYNVITVCLKVADKLHFFNENAECEKALQRFLRDIVIKIGCYKGDLQIACFHTLLSAPICLIVHIVNELVRIWKIVLSAGSKSFLILEDCLDTLEKWYTDLPKELMNKLLRSILPYFNVFLQSKDGESDFSKLRELKSGLLKLRGRARKLDWNISESQLFILQKKFLVFLGKLEHNIVRHIMDSVEDEEEEEYDGKKLTYDIPLMDTKLRLYADELLPRIIELSLFCSDRCTRVRACEFLHAAVALTLGNMKQMNGELNNLFRKIVSLCFLLGCDPDPVIRQLYSPLSLQLVHYFSYGQRDSLETQIFVDCLVETVSHPHNSSVREFGAKLIREFAQWSLKTSTNPGETPNNIKLILRSMYSLSVHPSHNKRRGAAIVFHNIYCLIKDETDLLMTHWFLFYYFFIECLCMCSVYDDTTHILKAIELITTSLKENSFTREPEVPPGFSDKFIKNPVNWILSYCSHSKSEIRKLSMSVVEKLARDSVKVFMVSNVKDIHVEIRYLNDNANEEDFLNWLRYSSALLDYYAWLLLHDVVCRKDIEMVEIQRFLEFFVDKIREPGDKVGNLAVVKAEAVVEVLQFLVTSTYRQVNWQSAKMLNFVKNCLYRPSDCNFETVNVGNREKLDSVLRILIPNLVATNNDVIRYLSDIDNYCCNVNRLGQYLEAGEPLTEMLELFHGLKIMYDIQLWNSGLCKFIHGESILRLLFHSLFVDRRRQCFSIALEANEKLFLSDLLKFSMKIGITLSNLIELIKNSEEIIEEETFRKNTKGEYFLELLQDDIFDYFLQNGETGLDSILQNFGMDSLKIIANILKYTNLCEEFVVSLSRRFIELVNLSNGNNLVMLSILKSMCIFHPDIITCESIISEWVIRIIANNKDLVELEMIFDVLPYLSKSNEVSNDALKSALHGLFITHEFVISNSDEQNPKIASACKAMLKSFLRSKSVIVLEEVTKLLANHNKLLMEQDIEDSFIDISQTSIEHLKNIFSFLYQELFKNFNNSMIYECFLEKFLQKCESNFAFEILLDYFDDLLLTLKGERLESKICALKIIQSCIVRAKKEELENLPNEKKEAFRQMISICSKIPLTSPSEIQRKYACACFNTLCTVISVKSDDPRLYKALIFREDFPLLPYLIHQTSKWVLTMDFDELPKRRKVLIALRKTLTKERQVMLGKTVSSIKYYGETLFDSSLREDVTRFDFSGSIIRPMDSVFNAKTDGNAMNLEIEMDAINSHECMPTLIGIVKHLVDDGITPVDAMKMPFWLSPLIQRMKSLNSSENEKIFLLKLMNNLDEYIKPYAGLILSDILCTLLEVFHGKKINYLIMDIVTMFLNWKLDLATLDKRVGNILTRLALHVIKGSDSYRKDIIKSNLEVAKLLIETFRTTMDLKSLSVEAFEMLKTGNKDTNYLNFLYCDILLANSIPAWTCGSEEEFLELLLNHFSGTFKKLAAEITGRALKYLENQENAGELIEKVRVKIRNSVLLSSVNDFSVLYGIHKNFPEISSSFLGALRNSAWTMNGQFKVESLEMLHSHVATLSHLENDMFGSTIYSFILDMLSVDDFEAVGWSLKIVDLLLDKGMDKKMEDVVEKALTFSDCQFVNVRKSVYSIAGKWNFDDDIGRQCRVVLLNGMDDPDGDLREKCLQFWYERTRESSSEGWFLRILTELYSPRVENRFLSFAARLIIRSLFDTPGFKNVIFEHPLIINSTFHKRNISTSFYRYTNPPSFAMSLSSSSASETLPQPSAPFEEAKTNIKRFMRNPRNLHRRFPKKKAESQEQGMDSHFSLVREYEDGDFPYIQISHCDILKPLEALVLSDLQIARRFITLIYDGLAMKLAEARAEPIHEKIRCFVDRVMRESISADPATTAFLFHILLHSDGRLEADSESLMKLAKCSGWLSVGGLLLEETIIHAENDAVCSPKKKSITPDEKRWFGLADVCRSLEEFETLRGIFLDKLQVVETAREAIRFESVSDWSKASVCYESLLKSSISSKSFYVDAYMTSLAQLGNWTKLNTFLRNTYNLNDLWSEELLFDKILPWFVKSENMISLETGNTNSVLDFLKEIHHDPDKDFKLKNYFAQELAIACFSNVKIQWVSYHLHQMCMNFLSTWLHWNRWANKLRESKLIHLQLMAELQLYITALTEKKNTEEAVNVMLNTWSKNRPQASDNLISWDIKLKCRRNFINILRKSSSVLNETEIEKCEKLAIEAEVELVKSGIAQNNFQISEKYLKYVQEGVERSSYQNIQLIKLYKSSIEMLREVNRKCEEKGSLKRLLDAALLLDREMSNAMDTNQENGLFLFECNVLLSKVMRHMRTYTDESEMVGYLVPELWNSNDHLQNFIKNKEIEYLMNATRAAVGVSGDAVASAHLELVKYYRRNADYSTEVVRSLFRSMSLGNRESRHLFCCLLNETRIVQDWTVLKDSFDMVPVWMFIMWKNQIFANLDSEMFPFLKDVILALVAEYPNAVRDGFRLSKESYKYLGEYGVQCRALVDEIDKKLSDSSYQQFLTALSYIVSPDLFIKYELNKILSEISSKQLKWEQVFEKVRDLNKRIYGEEYREFRGSVFDVLKPFKQDFEVLCTLECKHSLWVDKVSYLIKNIPKSVSEDTLKSYSPWLYGFQCKNQDIEIPGQYDGEQKPIPKHHIMVSSFKSSVIVMNSKCRPIRVSILGNNALEFKFLVKFGEDLRQDQRIQQVFCHMNHVLHTNQQTSRLTIDTYKVIPLKSNLGLIEWVNNTRSLQELLNMSGGEDITRTMERVQQEHLRFLSQGSDITSPIASHINGYMKVSRDVAVARFNERVYAFSWDLLKKAFWCLSSCPEQFIYLRKSFAESEAVIFIAHWLAGIGDRHLENTLVSSKTGRAVGIDFGCAFGFATEFLTPPELVPFRLTPQIVNLMKPLEESGLIKETMIQCLRSLRCEHSVLLAALEVFVREPALDWLDKAKRDQKFGGNSEWSPERKISMVREKLNGVNPIEIFEDDLRTGHSNKEYLEKYLQVLHGNDRSSKCCILTEVQQVNILIDLAMDKHILSKTYVGWNPWL